MADISRVLKLGQWVAAKPKSCATLVPGVTVDWKADAERGYGSDFADAKHKPGEEILVCIGKGCKAHPKEYEKQGSGVRGQGSGGYDPKAQEEHRAELKAQAIEENKIRMFVASNAIAAVKSIPPEALRAIAIAALSSSWLDERVRVAIIPTLTKVLRSSPVTGVEFAQALALVSIEELAAGEHQGSDESGRERFLASLKRVGYDGAGAWKKPEKQGSGVRGQGSVKAKAKAKVKAAPAKPEEQGSGVRGQGSAKAKAKTAAPKKAAKKAPKKKAAARTLAAGKPARKPNHREREE